MAGSSESLSPGADVHAPRVEVENAVTVSLALHAARGRKTCVQTWVKVLYPTEGISLFG